MTVSVIEREILSADKIHMLKGKVYLPNGEAKGIFHVVHGMQEHIGRYDSFMQRMAKEGYICFGYDHLGHGKTAEINGDFGFIAKSNGWQKLVADVANFAYAIRTEFGDTLPYYLLGHSMGSFIVRLAATMFVKPDKLIIMGTGGPNPVTNLGLAVISIIKAIKGDRYISKFVADLAFGSYNDRYKEENDPSSWLTTDESIRAAHKEDIFCSYRFSVSAMHDLITLNKLCNIKKWFKEFPKDLPTLIVSGREDPVGNYGKGVDIVFNSLKQSGADVDCKIYQNCRHEILNDTCKEQTITDILEFIK